MKRVVILGRGAAGKSTLDFTAEWIALQEQLVQKDSWILDEDLGPHDAVEVRLR